MRRAFLVALSFANLAYLRIWSEVLTYGHADTYLMTTPPRPVEYIALMANVLVAATVIWGLSILAGRMLTGKNFRFAEMAVVVGLCIPLNALRAVLSNYFPYLKSPMIELLGLHGVMILGACIAVFGLIATVFFHRVLSLAITSVLLVLSPFCVVTFAQAIMRAARYDDINFQNKPQIPLAAGAKKSPRVVWFIADEWDYRLTFVDRDKTLPLPEMDRLRATSFFADKAYPPGPETPVSIPGYYTGRLVQGVRYDGPRELQITYRGQTAAVPWSTQPNVFKHARELGFHTAMVEWFHPTCRVLNGLDYCSWRPLAMQYNSMGEGFPQVLLHQTRSLFETNLFSLFGRSLTSSQHTGVYQAILHEAESLSVNPEAGFTVVHLPIPHAPHTYNRKTQDFTLGNSPVAGYIDSLALLDRTIGELRRTMENAGTWDATTVLFTSDHPYREAEALDGKTDLRIPYLLKLGSQKQMLSYGEPFNTVLTGELLLAVLRGEVTDPAGAASWLDRNRSRFPLN